MRIRRSNEDKLEIGMSSLIDCVFLLLIFFLVTTIAKKENRDIDIDDMPISSLSSLERLMRMGGDSGSFYFCSSSAANMVSRASSTASSAMESFCFR